MKRAIAKELFIYAILLVILPILMHPDLLESPSSRISLMLERENFYHPFVYALIVYTFLYIFRFFIKKTLSLMKKFKNI